MVQKLQIYKCMVCGITVEVIGEGGGKMICCGEPTMLAGNTCRRRRDTWADKANTSGPMT